MDILIVVYVICLLILLEILYFILRAIRYAVKMISFSRFINGLKKIDGICIRKHRSLFKACFGEKGRVDYTISVNGKEFEIRVITFISTNGRWNFEKDRDEYFVECRRRHRFFYKNHVNAEAPAHALDYKRESRLSKKPLMLDCENEKYDKQILLVYPWPYCVSHTDFEYRELTSGDKIGNYVVMDAEYFSKTILPTDEA